VTLSDILSRLDVKSGSGGHYMARCPCHNDRQASLSVGIGNGGNVVLHCFAGCDTGDIVKEMGLTMRDLFVDLKPTDVFPSYGQQTAHTADRFEAEYIYPSGLKKVKMRRADGEKYAYWLHREGSRWAKKRNGIEPGLYSAGDIIQDPVYLVEGEKDVDTMKRLGFFAATLPDGANSKWLPAYSEALKGKSVFIIQDNDKPGKEFAQRVAGELHKVAKLVKVLDLSTVWPDIPEHGDVTDMADTIGIDAVAGIIPSLANETEEWKERPAEDDPLISCFKTLDEFQEEEAKWLVPGWIPEAQITLIAADGGIGKTTLWCHIIAAVSNGSSCILDPPGFTREARRVTFFTTEDSIRKKLRKKLRLAGANMKNIITPDFVGDNEGLLHKLKFGSAELGIALRYFKPVLCVFDPVQGFTPPNVNMGSRNEMRDCMAPLISIGEEVNTTSIVVCHTNKRKAASGRERIADSADLWDIARSVIMAGFTDEQGVRYLSNEKNNYAQLQETVLFTINDDGQIQKVGTSWKRDREYVQGAENAKSAPNREDCKSLILKTLNEAGGALPTADLDAKAKTAGYSFTAIKRAKAELKAGGGVKYFSTGSAKGNDRVWHIQALVEEDKQQFIELPPDTPTPFDADPVRGRKVV